MVDWEPQARRQGLALTFVKSLVKLSILVLAVVLVASLVFRAGVTPDRHGVQAYRDGRPIIGAWLGDWPSDEEPLIEDFEQSSKIELDVVDIFLDWRTPVENVTHTIEHISQRGALASLSWEPQTVTTIDILEGTKRLDLRDGRKVTIDDYLTEFGTGLCAVAQKTQQPVLVRTMHEMNGHWFAWGLTYERDGHRVNTPESYVQAWIKVHGLVKGPCPGDVVMVWAINHHAGGANDVPFSAAFPGDAYVDIVGIDGYNWGDNAGWGWTEVDQLFANAYCALTPLTNRPIIIAETGSSERGGDKAQWIHDLFQRVHSPAYPRLMGLVWLHDAKYEVEIGGAMDWQVTSSPQALEAFSQEAQALQATRLGNDDRVVAPVEVGPAC